MEGYLRNYIAGQQRAWVKWLYSREYCCDSTYYMSIWMTPFRALYGYELLSFIDLALEDNMAPLAKDWVQDQ